jgi:hypothetical protein
MSDAEPEREDHELIELRLRIEKLGLENKQLEYELSGAGRFSKHVWPVLSSGFTVAISIAALVISLYATYQQTEAARKEQRASFLAVHLITATNDGFSAARRVSAIWGLSILWDDERQPETRARESSRVAKTRSDLSARVFDANLSESCPARVMRAAV